MNTKSQENVYTDINTFFGYNGVKIIFLYDIPAINNKLSNLLTCRRGERYMEPEFGTRIWHFIHELCDEHTANDILHDLYGSIERWMPEIQLDYSQSYCVPNDIQAGFNVRLAFFIPLLQQQSDLSFSISKS